MSKTKVILICQVPLPYNKIGSWTNMYNYLLKNGNHNFDYIICPELEDKAQNVTYRFVRKVNIFTKVKNKILSKSFRFSNYFEALRTIVVSDEKYLIHIVDNSGIIASLNEFIRKNYLRSNFFIQYYYQGFSPLYSREIAKDFLYGIDEFIFLTELSYKEYLRYYDDCPFKVRILHNATDLEQFKLTSKNERDLIRKNHGILDDEFVFLWCSQDRVKKGLHIVLSAFKKMRDIHGSKIKLLVIGIDRTIDQEGVQVIGRVPNHNLARYYQMSDVYLFPSLWKEGFGIVLAEALNCGCYVIASAQGGIPEVLKGGSYGVLINRPNIVEDWTYEMDKAMLVISDNNGNPFLEKVPKNVYSSENWAANLKNIIDDSTNGL